MTARKHLNDLLMLHVVHSINPKAGGPSIAIRQIVAQYPAVGVRREVLCLDPPNSPFFEDLGCAVHALGPVSTTYGFHPGLLRWLRANYHRYDGFVVHGLWQYTGLCVRLAVGGKKPYVVFTHGMLDPYFKRAFPLKHLKKWLYWVPFEYWVLRGANRVFFTAESEQELAEKSFWMHRWNGQVVSYGASPPRGQPEHYQEIFGAAFPHLQGRRFLLFLGRIHPKKGCDLLLDAFAKTAAEDPNLDLVFAGPDQTGWQQKLADRARSHGLADRVHWLGMLYGDMKWGAFQSCEAFVLPSHQENFGIAVAEALACGKPVLISDKVNIWKPILEDGAAIVANDTAKGTLELLRGWNAISPEQKTDMGRNALLCFQSRYDMEENARVLIRLFAEIATPGPDSGKPGAVSSQSGAGLGR